MSVTAQRGYPGNGTILQGWVLVSTAWLSTVANSLLGPVMPDIGKAFEGQNHLELMISFVQSFPNFGVAILAMPFGFLADRIGHKKVLFTALVLYGIFGTAPLWLPTLPLIVASRALVGVTEAAIMTCGTALIGDYFLGDRRKRYLALQTGTAPLAALVVVWLGGQLGEAGWRYPFFAYTFAFVLVPLVGLLVREPKRSERQAGETSNTVKENFSWLPFLGICLVTVFGMTAFLLTIMQSGFILEARGIASPAERGQLFVLASLANPVGALIFALLPWRSVPKLIPSFVLLTAGFAIIALMPTWQWAVAGMTIANFGGGMLLPTLITWALSTLPASQRGMGTGVWMTASFLGQFLSPFAVVGIGTWLAWHTDPGLLRIDATYVYAWLCGGSAIIALLFTVLGSRKAA